MGAITKYIQVDHLEKDVANKFLKLVTKAKDLDHIPMNVKLIVAWLK